MFKILPLFLALSSGSLSAAEKNVVIDKPNVVLILTDDLGWQDVQCYDIDKPTPFETPNINRLAKMGVKFTNGYSPAPTCAPTRCSILTGKFPARIQKTHVVGGTPPVSYNETTTGIAPWYSGRMEMKEVTIAEALSTSGYRSAAVGKWHCAINHRAFPRSSDQGFQYSKMSIGETKRMADRSKDFATTKEGDPFKLDENGFPYHQNTEDALTFLKQQSQPEADPFFLYFATFLVHTPIHTRNEALLKKYCEKMGVEFPKDPTALKNSKDGQNNPYYGAMVETLDYHVGRIINYLEATDDPRNPGKKLIDTTYIIFTSDNGGMERDQNEYITDNFPLDKGKINLREGGTRVPLLISGPKIPKNTVSDELITGLDFYPTILSWTNTKNKAGQHLDGLNITELLEDPESNLERNTLYWHFPHSVYQSTIRENGYKLIYSPINDYLGQPYLELYELYDENGKRVDIEEAHNLAKKKPALAARLHKKLQTHLNEVNASQPFLNPAAKLPKNDLVPIAESQSMTKNAAGLIEAQATFKENGAKVVEAQAFYTLNGTEQYEEWYRAEATITGNTVTTTLPKDTTHYSFALIDENHFIVNYPNMNNRTKSKGKYAHQAFTVAK